MNTKQVVIFSSALGTAIMIAILCLWQIFEVNRGVDEEINRTFMRAQLATEQLQKLKNTELENIAQTFLSGPMIRSSLLTRDKETIQDVLNSLAEENGMQAIQIINENNEVEYKSVEAKPADLIAKVELPIHWDKKFKLQVVKSISSSDLKTWTEISGMQYAYAEALDQGIYYFKPLQGTSLFMLLEKKIYREQFRQSRNRILLISMALFMVGLVYSVVLGSFAEKHLAEREISDKHKELWKKLLDEIEMLKRQGKTL